MNSLNIASFILSDLIVKMLFEALENKEIRYYEKVGFRKFESITGALDKYKFYEDNVVKESSDKVFFDTESKIDVIAARGNECVGIEVKLGESFQFPGQYLTNWKRSNSNLTYRVQKASSKNPITKKYITASMINFLDCSHKLKPEDNEEVCNFIVQATKSNENYTLSNQEWWLVVRAACLKEDGKIDFHRSTVKDFSRLSRVFVFEDLWQAASATGKTEDIKTELQNILHERLKSLG